MNIGDQVITPYGLGQIIHEFPRHWTFGRPPRRTPLYMIRYPNGKQHAWAADKLLMPMRTATKGARMTTEQPDPESTEQPNPDQTELQPDPEPDKPSTDDEPETDEDDDDAGQEDQ